METKTILVTPEMASDILNKNLFNNRHLNKNTVDRYATEMKAGKWGLTGDTIKISKNGNLIDGQHRLKAVIIANKPIQFLFVYGIDENLFHKMDIGKNRSSNDMFSIAQIKNGNTLSSMIAGYFVIRKKRVWGYLDSCFKNERISKSDLLEFYYKYELLLNEIAKKADSCYRKLSILVRSEYGAIMTFLIIEKNHNQEIVFDFFNQLSGLSVSENITVTFLREKLLKDRLANKKMLPKIRMFYIIKTWNYFIKNKEVSDFRYLEENIEFI